MFSSPLNQLLIFTVAALSFGAILLFLSLAMQRIFRIGRSRQLKGQEYECGIAPSDNGPLKVDIKYYLFALLFMVFDVEFIFLIPWAMSLNNPRLQTSLLIMEALLFMIILGAGLYYAYKNKALDWE